MSESQLEQQQQQTIPISFRATSPEELARWEEARKAMGLNRSDFIRYCINTTTTTILGSGKNTRLKVFLFASVRGNDFKIQGTDPLDAYSRLVEREKENGSIWKLSDSYRNRFAVENQGFKWLSEDQQVCYKEIT